MQPGSRELSSLMEIDFTQLGVHRDLIRIALLICGLHILERYQCFKMNLYVRYL
jgi:hypothetical protein